MLAYLNVTLIRTSLSIRVPINEINISKGSLKCKRLHGTPGGWDVIERTVKISGGSKDSVGDTPLAAQLSFAVVYGNNWPNNRLFPSGKSWTRH